MGYFHLIQLHGYEDFGEDDYFGGLPYKKYLDIVQEIAGIALKHKDFCLALLSKNSKVDPYNIFTYTWYKDKTIECFADAHQLTFEQAAQAISCITLSQENIIHYAADFGNVLPPYISLASNQLTRTIQGSLFGGINFLKKELKRRYPLDYFNAVNKREERFRTDLYLLFDDERFINVNRQIIIKGNNFSTDIDALVFDKTTKSLGIFQLKWQDSYTTSLKERFSRISNLYPKSVEWINKVQEWISINPNPSISAKLGLQDYGVKDVGEVFLFVLGRNHVFFTGQTLDERAAWASWYQCFISHATIKATFDDPIRALHTKLKLSYPESKARLEGYPELYPMKIELDNFCLIYEPEHLVT